jgi:hypothetical protein
MQSYIRYLSFVALMFLFSCDKMPLFITCSDCTKDEPTTAILRIKLDGDALYQMSGVVINVYSGNLEDNILLATFSASTAETTYTVTLNKKYTITATYHQNSQTYIAVDSVTPGVKYDTSQCTDPCYFVYNNKVNLKLKYTLLQRPGQKEPMVITGLA